jgi:DNA-binding response OmpR family regulator
MLRADDVTDPSPGMMGLVGRRVLLVEDDARVRKMLRLALLDEGYEVAEAATGEAALEQLAERAVDVILLDVMLPGIDGFEVCRTLRRSSDVPVIMVTARSDSHDVVAGLEAGADDYITKPLVAKEMSARIRALLRRSRSDSGPANTVVGELDIRPDEGIVLRAGEPLSLTKTELRLLAELAQQTGRVISREELLERVWGYGYFGDSRLVDVHIRRLRTKVEREPSNPRHILTVRGLGYKLAP